jgi:hypothetical protein
MRSGDSNAADYLMVVEDITDALAREAGTLGRGISRLRHDTVAIARVRIPAAFHQRR